MFIIVNILHVFTYSEGIFLVLAVHQEISKCCPYKDVPHTSPALGVLLVGPTHVKPRIAGLSVFMCVMTMAFSIAVTTSAISVILSVRFGGIWYIHIVVN